jgi:uncharacterized membrane protein
VFAEPSDVEARCVDASRSAVTSVLNAVSMAIRGVTAHSWVTDAGAMIEMGAAVAETLRSVAVEAAVRVLRNPEGATQRSETFSDWSESVTVDAANIYFTKVEREQLAWAASAGYSAAAFPGLGTISTTRGLLETACPYDDPLMPEWYG